MGAGSRRVRPAEAQSGALPSVSRKISPRPRISRPGIRKRSRNSNRSLDGGRKIPCLAARLTQVKQYSAELQGRPSLAGKRNRFVYFPGQIALPDGASPPVLNKSFSVIADIEIPGAGA